MRLKHILDPKQDGAYRRSVAFLAKKYPAVENDLTSGYRTLEMDGGAPIPAGKRITLIPGIQGHKGKVVKVRLESTDQQSGKSGGFRVLLYRVRDEEWMPIVAYAKSQDGDLPLKEILKAISEDTGSGPVDT